MEGATVLVVDDDESYLDYVRVALDQEGLRVVAAPSAYTARQTLARDRYAVVLADLRLPGSSGLEILEAARRADPVTVGVVMTAFGSVESALDALRQGAYDYLLKPCPPRALQAAVRRAVEHHELRRRLLSKTEQVETLRLRFRRTASLIEEVSSRYDAGAAAAPAPGLASLRSGLDALQEEAARLGALLDAPSEG